MSEKLLLGRYEVVQQTEDRFVTKSLVKDHKAFGKLRTILSVTDNGLGNPNVVDWFCSQAELFTSISSDHVVDFIDSHIAGEMMESPAIVIEEPGISLAALMSKGAIHPLSASSIVTKILLGVSELHERGYLHLDIRPETIGVNESATEVKLLSLGNLMAVNSDAMALAPNAKYGAPECHIPTLKMDRGADIYSVGILFYEMLCGKNAFDAQFTSIERTDTDFERDSNWTNWHVSDKRLEPVEKIVSDVDEKLIECVHKMLDKDLSKRYTSAATAINALNKAGGSVASFGLTGAYSAAQKSNVSGSAKMWKVAGSVLGVTLTIGMGGILYGLNKGSSQEQVDMEQLNLLIAEAKLQQDVIELFAWSDLDEVGFANQTYDLVKEAYENDDLVGMYTNARESTIQYSAVIDARVGDVMIFLADEIERLSRQAKFLGVDDLPENIVVTSDYEDLQALQSSYADYNGFINELELAIRHNSRTVKIGSTQAQIDMALSICIEAMGSCPASWYQDELKRLARLTPFKMDITEVTVSEFSQYVDETAALTLAEQRNLSGKVIDAHSDFAVVKVSDLNWANTYVDDASNLPVVHISQSDAETYCASLGKRLPTEAEWELVAGGYEGFAYPWGQDWDMSLLHWGGTDEQEKARPVGSFPATAQGHFDLAGGVSEWTSTVDSEGIIGLIKGASYFDSNISNIRVSVRRKEHVEYSGEDVGFRCVEDLDEWPDYIQKKSISE